MGLGETTIGRGGRWFAWNPANRYADERLCNALGFFSVDVVIRLGGEDCIGAGFC